MRVIALAVLAAIGFDEAQQLRAGGRVAAAQRGEGAAGAGHHHRPCDLRAFRQAGRNRLRLVTSGPPQDGDESVAVLADRVLVGLPGQVARRLDRFFVGGLPAFDLRGAGDALLDDPFPHAGDAVELLLEAKAVFGLVSLVAATCRVPLRLGQLDDMEDRRLVSASHFFDAAQIALHERRVVPAAQHVDVDARPVVGNETAQHLGDR